MSRLDLESTTVYGIQHSLYDNGEHPEFILQRGWLFYISPFSNSFLCVSLVCTDSNFLLGSAEGSRGYPIVYCSDGFCELTGCARTEVMKKTCTCQFLHGQETSERVTQQVEKTLEGQREFQTEVRYYRKNGNDHSLYLLQNFIKWEI